MSGPKISWYEMSSLQRQNMNAQLKCDREIVSCANSIRQNLSRINISLEQFSKIENCGNDKTIKNCEELKNSFIKLKKGKEHLLSAFSEFSDYKVPPKVLLAEKELTKKKELLKKVKALNEKAKEAVDESKKLQNNFDNLIDTMKTEIEANLNSSLNLDWDISVAEDKKSNEKHIEQDLTIIKESTISELKQLEKTILGQEPAKRLKKLIEDATSINSYEYFKNFRAISVTPFIKECKKLSELNKTRGDYFEKLKSEYEVLCGLLHKSKKTVKLSEEGINFLETEISSLESEYENAKEEEFIANAIDAVMEDMGYSLIGNREVTKKSGKRFRDELYTFSEGTAVNIRYDNQGKIAMELGGIDNTDRLPSSSEASRLEDEMVAFCDKFTEFEKRLAAKGIVCKNRVRHLPPKAEYAQIINTSDYDMKTEVETFKTERRSAKNESKKQHRNE